MSQEKICDICRQIIWNTPREENDWSDITEYVIPFDVEHLCTKCENKYAVFTKKLKEEIEQS